MISEIARRAPGGFARLPEERDFHGLARSRYGVLYIELLRLDGKVRYLKPVVEERIARDVDPQRNLVDHAVADLDEAIRKPVAEAVLVEHGHRDIDVRLELEQPLARVGDRAVRHPLELDAVASLVGLREPDDVVGVHLEAERVARVADDLLRNRRRPVALRRLADDDHRAAIGGVPVLHRLQVLPRSVRSRCRSEA